MRKQLQFEQAFRDYSQALATESQVQAAYLGLVRIAFREQRWQEVVKFTNQLVKLNTVAYPAAYLYNAAANYNLGDLTAAEKSARRFESLDMQHERPQVYLLLGDILGRKHDYKGAAEQNKIFLNIVPDAYDAHDIMKQIKTLEYLGREQEGNRRPREGGQETY